MAEDSFEKFLQDQKNKLKESGNIHERKDAWIEQINVLYRKVSELLSPYTRSGVITTKRETISIYEELLGRYDVPSLIIDFGPSRVHLNPIGTYLIGSPGRVDMVGLRSSVRIVLTPKDAVEPIIRITTGASAHERVKSPAIKIQDFVWKISTNPPRIKYSEITESTLKKALVEATNG